MLVRRTSQSRDLQGPFIRTCFTSWKNLTPLREKLKKERKKEKKRFLSLVWERQTRVHPFSSSSSHMKMKWNLYIYFIVEVCVCVCSISRVWESNAAAAGQQAGRQTSYRLHPIFHLAALWGPSLLFLPISRDAATITTTTTKRASSYSFSLIYTFIRNVVVCFLFEFCPPLIQSSWFHKRIESSFIPAEAQQQQLVSISSLFLLLFSIVTGSHARAGTGLDGLAYHLLSLVVKFLPQNS